MNRMVERIFAGFADGLKGLVSIGAITPEHLETTNRNRMNETHSLVWSLLGCSVFRTAGEEYVVAVEHALKSKGLRRRFSPDVSL